MKISRKVKNIFSFIGIADFTASTLTAIAAIEAWSFAILPYVGVCAVLGTICLAIGGAFEL